MKEDPRADPLDKDEYDAGIAQMDVLIEEWGRFLDESMQPFDLVPRDFHGVLDEKILNNVMTASWGPRSYKAEIEHEYPDLKDLYAEQIYVKYSLALYSFFQMMGFPRKTDPRAEIGQNDKYFWDEFMKRVEKFAVENVWDLFDYQVALVYSRPYQMSFDKTQFRGREVYTVVKDRAYWDFVGTPIVKHATNITEKIENGRFDHTGDGFVAVFVNGSDVVRNLIAGNGSISSDLVCVGIHNWKTGEGTVQIVKQDLTMNFASSFVDYPEYGIMRHRPGVRARHDRKKVV